MPGSRGVNGFGWKGAYSGPLPLFPFVKKNRSPQETMNPFYYRKIRWLHMTELMHGIYDIYVLINTICSGGGGLLI